MRISDWSSDVCSSDLLQDLGGAGLLVGGFSGAPYKLYAVQAASAGLGLPVFIACSIVARGERFLAVASLAPGIARWATTPLGAMVVRGLGCGVGRGVGVARGRPDVCISGGAR